MSMSTEEERLQQRLAMMSEAELIRWLSTFEQMRLIDTVFEQQLQKVVTDEVRDRIALLRAELTRRTRAKSVV